MESTIWNVNNFDRRNASIEATTAFNILAAAEAVVKGPTLVGTKWMVGSFPTAS
jgi:hypothetical protein